MQLNISIQGCLCCSFVLSVLKVLKCILACCFYIIFNQKRRKVCLYTIGQGGCIKVRFHQNSVQHKFVDEHLCSTGVHLYCFALSFKVVSTNVGTNCLCCKQCRTICARTVCAYFLVGVGKEKWNRNNRVYRSRIVYPE